MNIFYYLLLALALVVTSVGCKEEQKGKGKRGRIDYPFIKSTMNLSEDQSTKFDEVTETYGKMQKEVYEKYKSDKAKSEEEVAKVADQQDAEIKKIVNDDQFANYQREIIIERKGREKHNMELIKNELGLDSLQITKFDLANEAFYTTLRANHDNYHGKPDVYQKYYTELDVSRKAAFEQFMSPAQYNNYLQLVEKYNIGKPKK